MNNRFVKSTYIGHAIYKSYEGLIDEKKYPFYIIFINLDTSKVDINIHPTKTEINFEDDKAIYAILISSVKRSLGKYNIAPTLDFNTEPSFEIPINHNKIIKRIALKYDLLILDLFSKFKEQISSSNSIPYTTSELRRLRGLRAVILYYVFGWSWNRIGMKYKLQLLCDHIHLNERGGSLIENEVKRFLSK